MPSGVVFHDPFSKRRIDIMEQQTVLSTKPQSDLPKTQKQGYAPPKATFIPLKLEERLVACTKLVGLCTPTGLS